MQIPQKIGKYNIVERIGRGGMGYVYKAVDPILKRDIALKCMLKDITDDPDLRTRFMREAQSAGGLRHPNIVTIYDLGEDENGCPYIAMEFLTGTDLEHIIKGKIDLQLTKKLDIILQTCRGLGYAHSKGIVHRDIKPANIRLLDNGEIKIMDFGIARIAASHFTRTGMIMGTPHYMCPEQIRGEKVDGRADIFSLGVVLYELLVFRKPYPGDNPTSVLFKIIHSEPEPLVDAKFTPPEGLEQVIFRALAKKPEQRYQTCEEFYSDLVRVYSRLVQMEASPVESTVIQASARAGSINPTPSFRKAPVTPPPGKSQSSLSQRSASPTPSAQHVTTAKQEPAAVAGGASPTIIQTPTPVTARYYQQAPKVDRSPVSPFPIRGWLLLGTFGVVGLALVVVLGVGLIRKLDIRWPQAPTIQQTKPAESALKPSKTTLPSQPPINKEAPASLPAPALGWLSLNVQPWAEIKEIKNQDGQSVTPPMLLTPCKFQLEKGSYRITLLNSTYKPMIVQVEVKENETTVVNKKMEGFDYANAIDSFGL